LEIVVAKDEEVHNLSLIKRMKTKNK
jgi:hypothetical protein